MINEVKIMNIRITNKTSALIFAILALILFGATIYNYVFSVLVTNMTVSEKICVLPTF